MDNIIILIILQLMYIRCTIAASDLTCTEDYCSDYIDGNSCPILPDVCNGTTTDGIDYFPSPTTCNCCNICLVHLGENETCAQGVAGAPTTQYICGPGLTCTKVTGEKQATCKQMTTPCVKLQTAYDNRRANNQLMMTEVRPQCDARGRYAPAHCIQGSICYCVSPSGQRIFGEQPYTSTSLLHNMTCGCSLAAWTAQMVINHNVSTPHCLANGSYDPLQCIGDKCFCINSTAGLIDSTVANPLFISNVTLSCFDPELHTEGLYEGICERVKAKVVGQQRLIQLAGAIPIGSEIPDCSPDGKYNRLQTRSHLKVCVDPEGNQLENFAVDIDSSNATNMNCNCARTRWVLRNAGMLELPTCMDNGNYQAMQCYRSKCFCVDENGNQKDVEVDASAAASHKC